MSISSVRKRTISGLRQFFQHVKVLGPDHRGVAAIELAVIAGFLSVAVLNVADVSTYIFQRMEVENATQVGVQAAWKACDTDHLPATTNCSTLTQAVTNAIQSTRLGTRITLQANSPSEAYYCVNSTGALQNVSTVSSKPADCSAAGMAGLQPADYITVQTTFAYAPLFKGITVGNLLATPITSVAMMRMG
jgi:Flp pilus assembly protein TadG